MAISLNLKQNIGFTGLKQDIEQSRQIIAHVRKEFGRPHSNSYVKAKIYQHIDNDDKTDFLIRLCAVKEKYNKDIHNLRFRMQTWAQEWADYIDLDQFIAKYKELIKHFKAANCGDFVCLVQHEHLKQGIKADNVNFAFIDKKSNKISRDHEFSVRGLSKKADIKNITTWGQDAIVVDAWTGSGIVARAQNTPITTYKNVQKIKGEFIEGGVYQILKFLKFNPEKEKLAIRIANFEFAEEFMLNNRKNLR